MAAPRTTTTSTSKGPRGPAPRAPAYVPPPREVHGTARLGKRTKALVRRLDPGDIAVIDHRDIDRMAAEDLVESGVKAVVNVAPSASARYPNPGPLILAQAGVHLVDVVGAPLFEEISDGDPITVRGGAVVTQRGVVAEGQVRTLD